MFLRKASKDKVFLAETCLINMIRFYLALQNVHSFMKFLCNAIKTNACIDKTTTAGIPSTRTTTALTISLPYARTTAATKHQTQWQTKNVDA